PVGLPDFNANDVSIIVYPSPAKEVFFIEGMQAKEVSLTDITGRAHMRALYTESGVNVTGLPAGIFFVNIISSKGERVTRKISLVK
ncbi:MAG: T9SS type A sorting domain-containing protein, partial [Bacteroidota bacterium]